MNNIIIFPIIIPFIIGALLIIFAKNHRLQRIISGTTAIGLFILSIYLAVIVYQEGPIVLEAGHWPAPFGIVLIADIVRYFNAIINEYFECILFILCF